MLDSQHFEGKTRLGMSGLSVVVIIGETFIGFQTIQNCLEESYFLFESIPNGTHISVKFSRSRKEKVFDSVQL